MKLHSGYLISLVFLMRVINTTLIVIMPTLPKNIYTISKIFVNVDSAPRYTDRKTDRTVCRRNFVYRIYQILIINITYKHRTAHNKHKPQYKQCHCLKNSRVSNSSAVNNNIRFATQYGNQMSLLQVQPFRALRRPQSEPEAPPIIISTVPQAFDKSVKLFCISASNPAVLVVTD